MTRTTRQIYVPAFLIAVATLASLGGALLGNDTLKMLSCVVLSVPLLILVVCLLRGRFP